VGTNLRRDESRWAGSGGRVIKLFAGREVLRLLWTVHGCGAKAKQHGFPLPINSALLEGGLVPDTEDLSFSNAISTSGPKIFPFTDERLLAIAPRMAYRCRCSDLTL